MGNTRFYITEGEALERAAKGEEIHVIDYELADAIDKHQCKALMLLAWTGFGWCGVRRATADDFRSYPVVLRPETEH